MLRGHIDVDEKLGVSKIILLKIINRNLNILNSTKKIIFYT